MSYPYDTNPWDDNYNANAGQQHQTSYSGAGSYTDGYSNPMAQYSDADPSGREYQNDDQQQQQYGNEAQQDGQQQQPPPAQSTIGRFIRQRIPLCGSIMDTLSSINLPFIDALVQKVNRDLLVSKMFYFFFYSAFGSLFPLMGVYFKQLGMNPAQVGILTGVRPIIEIFSAPFWNSLAEKFQKSKALLLFSVLSWIVFTYSLAHIRPPASACIHFNNTHFTFYVPYTKDASGNDVNAVNNNERSKITNSIEATSSSEGEQRKQRRRKRQASRGDLGSNDGRQEGPHSRSDRYAYSTSRGKDNITEMRLDLNVDLENDFDDRLVGKKETSGKRNHHAAPFFKPEASRQIVSGSVAAANSDDSPEYDELEQLYSKGIRYKRSPNMRDSEESDEDEEQDHARAIEETNKKRDEKNEEKEYPKGDDESDEQTEGQEDEEDRSSNETDNNHSEDRHNQQSPPTTILSTNGQSSSVEKKGPESQVSQHINNELVDRYRTPPTHIVGMSPITVEYAADYNKTKHSQYVTPMFSSIVYKLDSIKEVFFLLLLLISLGEFFSAPALTLADSATLSYLGENTDLYGRQRMFGSFSWAITLLLVGMALDKATAISDHPCGPHTRERSYTVCFVIFSLLMACAFLTATQFRFNYPKWSSGGNQTLLASTTDNNTIVTTTIDSSKVATGNIDELYASTQPRSIFNTAPPVNAPPPDKRREEKEKFEFIDKWKSAVFAQRTWEVPEWVNVFRQFRNSLHLMYLFITWFLGCGVGLVFTFLFWHLQDVGGTPTLFGICSVINHISEILAYFFSFKFIKMYGHTRILSVGLGCNVIRFLYVAFLTNPYYALPFELVQGITHAACFAACCSYISHVSKPELRTSTQGVMQGLHHGIGRACGALLGGYMINAIGSRAAFGIYGLLSGCVLAGFLYVRKKASALEDEEVKVDDSEALGGYGAPQGVPSAIPSKVVQNVPAQDIDYQW